MISLFLVLVRWPAFIKIIFDFFLFTWMPFSADQCSIVSMVCKSLSILFPTSSMSSAIAKGVTPSFVISVSKSFMSCLNSFEDKGLP